MPCGHWWSPLRSSAGRARDVARHLALETRGGAAWLLLSRCRGNSGGGRRGEAKACSYRPVKQRAIEDRERLSQLKSRAKTMNRSRLVLLSRTLRARRNRRRDKRDKASCVFSRGQSGTVFPPECDARGRERERERRCGISSISRPCCDSPILSRIALSIQQAIHCVTFIDRTAARV